MHDGKEKTYCCNISNNKLVVLKPSGCRNYCRKKSKMLEKIKLNEKQDDLQSIKQVVEQELDKKDGSCYSSGA